MMGELTGEPGTRRGVDRLSLIIALLAFRRELGLAGAPIGLERACARLRATNRFIRMVSHDEGVACSTAFGRAYDGCHRCPGVESRLHGLCNSRLARRRVAVVVSR